MRWANWFGQQDKAWTRQLNEHAEHVASIAGRALVQTIEGLDQEVIKEYCELISFTPSFL